jgi:hypothetical protein
MDFIDSDRTLKFGEYVFHNYSKNNFLWKITKITRRFLTKEDLHYGVYKGGNVGDEYNPLVEIEAVADFNMHPIKKKFRKQTKVLDAAYLIKADAEVLQNHIDEVKKILSNFDSN